MRRFSSFFLLMGGLGLGLPVAAQTSSLIDGSFAAWPTLQSPAPLPLAVAEGGHHSSQLPSDNPMPAWPARRRSASDQASVGSPAADWGDGPAAPPASAALPGGPAASSTLAGKTQLLLLQLETLQAQQVQLATLRAQADVATRRASEAEAATVAFEQRLRQLESNSARPNFWR